MHDNTSHAEIELALCNEQGLHLRPITRFVDTASQFKSTIRVRKGDTLVDGKSPMEMTLVVSPKGTVLTLIADGEDAQAAVEALAQLIRSKFDED